MIRPVSCSTADTTPSPERTQDPAYKAGFFVSRLATEAGGEDDLGMSTETLIDGGQTLIDDNEGFYAVRPSMIDYAAKSPIKVY